MPCFHPFAPKFNRHNVLQTFVTVSCTRTSVLMVSRYLNTVFIFLSNILNRIILKMHPKKVSFKSNVTARFPDETLLSKEFVKSDGIAQKHMKSLLMVVLSSFTGIRLGFSSFALYMIMYCYNLIQCQQFSGPILMSRYFRLYFSFRSGLC